MEKDNKAAFISYLDEDNNKIKSYGNIISIHNNLIEFTSDVNNIVIPTNRVLKIKRKTQEGDLINFLNEG